MKFKRINKKGTLDNLWLAIQIFGFALFMLVIVTVWNLYTTDDMDTKLWDNNEYTQSIKAQGESAYNRMDSIYMMAYIGLHLGVLVLAYFLRSHPVVLVVIFLVAAIIALISAPLSNVFQDIVSDEDIFADAASELPRMRYVVERLPLFETIWCFITGIVLIGLARLD